MASTDLNNLSNAAPSQLYDQVGALVNQRRYKEASALVDILNNRFPEFAKGWSAASLVAFKLGSLRRSEEMARKAAALAPSDQSVLTQFALTLTRTGKFSEAVSVLDGFADTTISDHRVLTYIGSAYAACQAHGRAERFFARAVEEQPADPQYLLNLGGTQRFNGNLAEAEQTYKRAIEQAPDIVQSYVAVTGLRKQEPDDIYAALIEKRLSNGSLHWRDEVALRYALAKVYEDLQEWDACFFQLKLGGDLKRKNTKYTPEKDIKGIREIMRLHTAERLAASKEGFRTQEPIFVLGLPRSGTTLVERILSSHSEVCSLDELREFPKAMLTCVQEQFGTHKLPRDELIRASAELEFETLGRKYMEFVEQWPRPTSRFIDKLPTNFLYLGLIFRALPDAKVLHLNRHPLDSIFAIYKTLFGSAYPWSYDLVELTEYYIAYDKLLNHWRKEFPGRIFDVHYEALVADQQKITREMLAFCNLSWEDQCLEFYKSATPSMTQSTVQVRQPIYSSSVQKWRKFEKQMGGVIDRLCAEGILVRNAL